MTLLEVMLIILVIGVLAVMAISQYGNTSEKARATEARLTLSRIRDAEFVYYERWGAYTGNVNLLAVEQNIWNPCSSNTSYYQYSASLAVLPFMAAADRCTAGGKLPSFSTPYRIILFSSGDYNCTFGNGSRCFY